MKPAILVYEAKRNRKEQELFEKVPALLGAAVGAHCCTYGGECAIKRKF